MEYVKTIEPGKYYFTARKADLKPINMWFRAVKYVTLGLGVKGVVVRQSGDVWEVGSLTIPQISMMWVDSDEEKFREATITAQEYTDNLGQSPIIDPAKLLPEITKRASVREKYSRGKYYYNCEHIRDKHPNSPIGQIFNYYTLLAWDTLMGMPIMYNISKFHMFGGEVRYMAGPVTFIDPDGDLDSLGGVDEKEFVDAYHGWALDGFRPLRSFSFGADPFNEKKDGADH